MSTTINLSDPNQTAKNAPYPLAIFTALASLLLLLLITPPFVTHFKNRNIGATVLVFSGILGLLLTFLNAIIWSHDNISTWYSGYILCDIEIKLMGMLSVMTVSALAVILRGLAKVMDTNNSSWSITARQKKRQVALELLACVGLPCLQMLFQWINQPFRYYIYGIAGCVVPVDGTWLYILLTLCPPMLWILVDVYYSGKSKSLPFPPSLPPSLPPSPSPTPLANANI
jgi:pheromone a factor receptor